MSSRKSLSPISPMIPSVSAFDRTPRQSSYTYPTSNYPPSQPQPQSFIWPLHPSPPAPRSLAPPPPTAMHRRTPSLTSSVSSAHSGDSRPVTPADVAPASVPYPVKAHHSYPGQPGQAEYMDHATIDRLLRAPAMHTVPLPNVESATNPRVHAWLQSQSQSGSPASIPIHVEPPSPAPYQRAYAHGTSAFYPPPSSSHRAPPPGPYRPY